MSIQGQKGEGGEQQTRKERLTNWCHHLDHVAHRGREGAVVGDNLVVVSSGCQLGVFGWVTFGCHSISMRGTSSITERHGGVKERDEVRAKEVQTITT